MASEGGDDRRVFLVVADETREMHNALRFACRRAVHTDGQVALLGVVEPTEFKHWLGVGRVMEEEARAAVEARVNALAGEVFEMTGAMPTVYIRSGKRRDEVVGLIEEEPAIKLLVLGMAAGPEGPGPLVNSLIGGGVVLRVPVTLVPGGLEAEEIDALT
ncbi:MAG: universal stress protein [Alphaproteobacteria bacterium]|jgi:nucleotide-binding universal stress UspA family protein|nr:universal stress protein [Alphaproteobacteria bacterium]